MRECDHLIAPGLVCTLDADATLNGRPICADHLHLLHPRAVEAGHAERIPGVVLL